MSAVAPRGRITGEIRDRSPVDDIELVIQVLYAFDVTRHLLGEELLRTAAHQSAQLRLAGHNDDDDDRPLFEMATLPLAAAIPDQE